MESNVISRRSLLSLSLAGVAALGLSPLLARASEASAAKDAAAASDQGAITEPAGTPEAAAQLMAALNGTYIELFPVLNQFPEYWEEVAASIVGEADAKATTEMLMGACAGEIFGPEAVEAYADDPESAVFDCHFPEGVEKLTFADGTISGAGPDGAAVFEHAYEFLCYAPSLDFYVFQTADEDAGEFRYFVPRSDNTTDTYHLEFRFGSDLDDLLSLYTGAYAYAMPAAIDENWDEDLAKKGIELFVTENLTPAEE